MATYKSLKLLILSGFAASIFLSYKIYLNRDIKYAPIGRIYQESTKETQELADFALKIPNNAFTSDDHTAKDRKSRLPDIICIGVEKCGTGALLYFLTNHPLVRSTGRETHFFDHAFYRGLEYYKSLLPNATDEEFILDKTPAYYNKPQEDIARLIRKDVPNAKILAVLCDPVNRTYSDFIQEKAMNNIPEDTQYEVFVDQMIGHFNNRSPFPQLNPESAYGFIKAKHMNNFLTHVISTGLYYYHIKHWFEYYNDTNMMIINGEDLIKDPGRVLEEIQTFLKIPMLLRKDQFVRSPLTGFYCLDLDRNGTLGCLNEGKGRTRNHDIKIYSGTTKKLIQFYKSYSEQLFQLIGKRFDWQ